MAGSFLPITFSAHAAGSLGVDLLVADSTGGLSSDLRTVIQKSIVEPSVDKHDFQLDLTYSNTGSLTEENLDLATSVMLAVNSYPSVTEAVGRLHEQTAQVDVAKSGYYPQIGAGVSHGYRSSSGRSEQAFTVSVSQMLYDFGKVASLVNMAKFGVDRNYASVLKVVEDLIRDTSQAFIEVQRYQALLDIATQQIDAISELKTLAQQRVKMGASSRSDEFQAQSRFENAIALKLQLKAELDVWKRTLQNFIGRNEDIGTLSASLDFFPSACSSGAGDFSQVPQIMMAEADRAEALAAIENSEKDFYPTVSLDLNSDYFFNRTDTNPALEDQEVTATINIKSNLFQGGAMRARKRSAEYALRAAEAAKDTAYLDVTRRLREAKDKTRSYRSRLDNLDARYDTIVETQKLYRIQYLSSGTRTLLDILNTEEEIHQAMFDRKNTYHDLHGLQIDCLHSTGSLRDAFILEDQVGLYP